MTGEWHLGRIAERALAEEYFAVTEEVEALYNSTATATAAPRRAGCRTP